MFIGRAYALATGVRAMDRNTGKYAAWSAALLAAALLVGVGGGTAVQALAGSREAPTLVIDAGHGGFDGGAIGSDGTAEQDINLSIARRVQALAGFFGVRTAMTRADENALDYDIGRPIRENKVADIRARERIVCAADSPVFVSIHLNKFSDPQYHGAQVFYSPNHADSKTLAEALQACLAAGCDPANTRQAKQADRAIYLMDRLTCPAVIVECGFLSNPAEERLLNRTEYHKKLAACIVTGYLRYGNGG